MRPRRSRTLVRADNMHLHDQIPILVLHVLETDIPQDTGIVDQHIDAAVGLDSRIDDPIAILDRVVVGDGLAACGGDLVDDFVGGLGEVVVRVLWFVWCFSSVFRTDASPPSPLNEPPRSLTTTLAPLEAKKRAYALPSPPPAPVTTTVWPSYLSSSPAMLEV